MAPDFPVFPNGFVFGAASSAYQVEGAWNADGKGPSIWDAFAHTKGRIRQSQTGDVACDHYHRYPDDIRLMKSLGLDAYRGSISWPRIIPEGVGKPNPAGMDFYSRLTDALLESGITPWWTLFHWDLPLALQRRMGGFRSRDLAGIFADYVEVVVRSLADRVKHWITINEPWEYAFLGHVIGRWAPGLRNPFLFFPVLHNLLRAHGAALQRIRAIGAGATVGVTLSTMPVFPASGSERDLEAARIADEFINRVDFDPVLRGRYPDFLLRRARLLVPKMLPGDLESISQPIDFIGINYYTRDRARHAWYVPFLKAMVAGTGVVDREFERDGVPYTATGQEVYPEGLHRAAGVLRDEYGNPPVVITENGAAFEDRPEAGGVRDPKRTAYLQAHLAQASNAIREGCDIRGYFVWSLMDNFEWSEGTAKRFGIVHVDFASQRRVVKDSGLWYADLIRTAKARDR